uniref:Alkaline ceramidase n=2 Tax=Attheya septentrionalis TaxID=420275 RepID=A0A7S2UQ37_9STRA|mmetsp:Transcript_770/g.1417  ORF Transcript_770/g.1417 Transcript_770/m.1417 type:complete len:278 (+) Transcript_770:680-1513(+)
MGDATVKIGYWEPHSSSIDFCESNYLHTSYVAEPHNVWSSVVGLSIIGLLGFFKANPTHEWRFTLSHLTLILIGIGSACLHGTLHWVYQSSDELPMIYLIICLVYAVIESESPRGKPRYPWLPYVMVVLAAVNTAVYYTFQHLYWIFLLTYTLGVAVLLGGMLRLVFLTKGRDPSIKTIYRFAIISYAVGGAVWAFDMLYCNTGVLPVANMIPGWARGVTPHVIWHISAGASTYYTILAQVCCRLDSLGIGYKISHVFGRLLPFVTITSSEDAMKRD